MTLMEAMLTLIITVVCSTIILYVTAYMIMFTIDKNNEGRLRRWIQKRKFRRD
jgi:hypothetical protein